MLKEGQLEVIRELDSRSRRYASMREMGTKRQKELDVVADLLESMERRDESRYVNPKLAKDDPPDCTVETRDGERVALEVTEFVSQTAIEYNERADAEAIARLEPGAFVYAEWSETDLLEQTHYLLIEKDAKQLRCGPYARYAVVIHTNEPLLLRGKADEWLSRHTFGPFQQLDEAYFLFPYEPGEGYPFSRLKLDSA